MHTHTHFVVLCVNIEYRANLTETFKCRPNFCQIISKNKVKSFELHDTHSSVFLAKGITGAKFVTKKIKTKIKIERRSCYCVCVCVCVG